MKPDKEKISKFCLRQQTQECGVNILSGGNRKWQIYYLRNWAANMNGKEIT